MKKPWIVGVGLVAGTAMAFGAINGVILPRSHSRVTAVAPAVAPTKTVTETWRNGVQMTVTTLTDGATVTTTTSWTKNAKRFVKTVVRRDGQIVSSNTTTTDVS